MLENLRAMAVFACVVNNGSFSGAGRELGITTSAVSQQIRTLESELGITLLNRSTRKLSLTEAGNSFYASAKVLVKVAQEAKDNISQLRDDLLGNLRIATTAQLASQHILPALSDWLAKHRGLSLHLSTGFDCIDMIDERVDLSINFSEQTKPVGTPLKTATQFIVASPKYLDKVGGISKPEHLKKEDFIGLKQDNAFIDFINNGSAKVTPRFLVDDSFVLLELVCQGYGYAKTNDLLAKDMIKTGELVAILTEYELPDTLLCAKTLGKEQQPAKVSKCLEILTEYFSKNSH